jgi:hypothetical protein
MKQQPGEQNGRVCREWDRLFSDFEAAIAEIIAIQFESVALILGPKVILLQRAEEKKRTAKNALLSHMEAHVCR